MKGLAYVAVAAGVCLTSGIAGSGDFGNSLQSEYQEVEVEGGGTIHGVVRLSGDAVEVENFEVTKNADHCGDSKPSPRLVVGEGNGVQDAVVFIEGITQGKKIDRSRTLVLDQRDCEYAPHVLILPHGEQLEIVNSDPILHNVHGYELRDRRRSIFNIAQPVQGQRIRIKAKRFRFPGLVLATCDAGHAWMSAYIIVAEHPYFTLTDESGAFELENVPPGSYRLRMWHEGVLVMETELEHGKPKKYHFEEPYETMQELVVPASGEVRVEFELALR